MYIKFYILTVSEIENTIVWLGSEGVFTGQKGVLMSEYSSGNHCPECDATGGNHYPGCMYEGMDSNYRYSSGSGRGISTFGAIMCIAGGFLGVAFLLTLFKVGVDSVPTFILVILIIIITSIIAGVISALKER